MSCASGDREPTLERFESRSSSLSSSLLSSRIDRGDLELAPATDSGVGGFSESRFSTTAGLLRFGVDFEGSSFRFNGDAIPAAEPFCFVDVAGLERTGTFEEEAMRRGSFFAVLELAAEALRSFGVVVAGAASEGWECLITRF